jgi:hypothetical protein
MSIKQPYTTSIRHVGAYQVSGRPWCRGGIDASSSTQTIQFPFVTRWITIINNDPDSVLKVGFSSNGVGGSGTNYFTIGKAGTGADASASLRGTSQSVRLEVKCAAIYLNGSDDVDIVAGLTNIPRDQMPSLSGDGIG